MLASFDVRRVQSRLNEIANAGLEVDGVYGPMTRAAVVAFKRSLGLRARDFIGPITMEALFGGNNQSQTIPWMSEAVRVKGLHEARNRSALVKWFDAAVSWIDPREVPWCGAFVLTCIRRTCPDDVVPASPLAARSWAQFGLPVEPCLGSILVFWRGSRDGWQGHVGFYYGEDDAAYHVLGGNQSNAVTVTRISKSRLISARWPASAPISGRRVQLTQGGAPLSTNEA